MKKYLFGVVLLTGVVLFVFIFGFFTMKKAADKNVFAIAVFNDSTIKGTVKFTEEFTGSNKVKIDLNIVGLSPNSKHGFHVHEAGDLSDKCVSACAHFNPYGKTHGCPGTKERHVGDLGNISTNSKGSAKYSFYDDFIKLRGTKANIIGRSIIIHQDEDDCGKGGDEESLKTGNAGKRIACAVIGYSKENFSK